MTNGVTGVGVNNQNYQMAFKAKTGDRKMVHEFIDKSNDLATQLLNKDRPIAEKREIAFREFVSKLKMKDIFVGKKIKLKPEEITAETIEKGKFDALV